MAEKEPLVGEQKGDNDADVHVTVEDAPKVKWSEYKGETVTLSVPADLCARRLMPTGSVNRFRENHFDVVVRETEGRIESVISRKDFEKVVTEVNDILRDYWPCDACFLFGYCCCPVSLGLSFYGPLICVRQADTAVARRLDDSVNWRPHFLSKGVRWSYRRETCACGSRLEIEIPKPLLEGK